MLATIACGPSLRPAPAEDRRTLIRRAYFDLIRLPLSIAEVEAFAHDPSPDALAKVVDHLLVSPHYGERWGRHWLDVVRYADAFDSHSGRKTGVLWFSVAGKFRNVPVDLRAPFIWLARPRS